MLPDIIGFAEKKIKGDNGLWSWYVAVHSWDVVAYLAVATVALMLGFHTVLPLFAWWGWALHIAIDKVTHKSGSEWWHWPDTMWIELLGWALLIAFFAFKFL